MFKCVFCGKESEEELDFTQVKGGTICVDCYSELFDSLIERIGKQIDPEIKIRLKDPKHFNPSRR